MVFNWGLIFLKGFHQAQFLMFFIPEGHKIPYLSRYESGTDAGRFSTGNLALVEVPVQPIRPIMKKKTFQECI